MLEHLSSLMYLASSFEWDAVLSFHAAVLLDIEKGRASWGDSFAYLEPRTLYGNYRLGKRTSPAPKSGNKSVFFCQDFQKGICAKTKDHPGLVRGEPKFVKHICAACWLNGRVQNQHPESSKSCPHFSSAKSDKPQADK